MTVLEWIAATCIAYGGGANPKAETCAERAADCMLKLDIDVPRSVESAVKQCLKEATNEFVHKPDPR
jgi:hypothetical protein